MSKIFRLFTSEFRFKFKFIVIFALTLMVFGQFKTLHAKERKIVRLKDAREFALRVKENVPKTEVKPVVVEAPAVKKDIVLQGTSKKAGKLYVLINGEIFTEGDMLDDYCVKEITMKKAVLENRETKELRMLYLEG